MNAEEVARRLGGRRNGSGWSARCPAHNDRNPSLSISEGEGGRVLLHCHAGCAQEAVIDALRKVGMWPERERNLSKSAAKPMSRNDRPVEAPKAPSDSETRDDPAAPSHPQFGRPDSTFEYHDATGALIGLISRWDRNNDKTIRPAIPDGSGWRWAAFPAPRPLYRLPDISAHTAKTVLMVEGEKTAEAARLILDELVVTTWPGGAEATAKADLAPLIGRNVVLWPDNDEAGQKAMRDVAARLLELGAASVRVVALPPGLPAGWDLADTIPATLDIERLIADAPDARAERLAALNLVSAADLIAREFKPPKWAVPDLVPEGLTILAGRPKSGKSWLALDLGVSVAGGGDAIGNIRCTPGEVLYLALEDTERRLNSRLRAVLQGQPAPPSLFITTQWRRADQGGLDDLKVWLATHPSARLVMVDTLAKIRGRPDRDRGVYENDYAAVTGFKSLADQFTVPIVLVHHVNKEGASDPVMAVSGTAGLTGSADTIVVLKREPNDPHGLLYVRGRDVNEAEIALQFDNDTGKWLRLGAGSDFRKSQERNAIIRALAQGGPMTPKELADVTGKKPGAVRFLLHKMKTNGDVSALVDGRYAVSGS